MASLQQIRADTVSDHLSRVVAGSEEDRLPRPGRLASISPCATPRSQSARRPIAGSRTDGSADLPTSVIALGQPSQLTVVIRTGVCQIVGVADLTDPVCEHASGRRFTVARDWARPSRRRLHRRAQKPADDGAFFVLETDYGSMPSRRSATANTSAMSVSRSSPESAAVVGSPAASRRSAKTPSVSSPIGSFAWVQLTKLSARSS